MRWVCVFSIRRYPIICTDADSFRLNPRYALLIQKNHRLINNENYVYTMEAISPCLLNRAVGPQQGTVQETLKGFFCQGGSGFGVARPSSRRSDRKNQDAYN
jgi:hypothetical protein